MDPDPRGNFGRNQSGTRLPYRASSAVSERLSEAVARISLSTSGRHGGRGHFDPCGVSFAVSQEPDTGFLESPRHSLQVISDRGPAALLKVPNRARKFRQRAPLPKRIPPAFAP